MSSHHPPLTCAEFKTILGKLEFVARAKKSGTSHEDWVKTLNGRLYKVTVDCPKAPFSQDLISSMAKQAGVTKAIIYDIHFGRRTGADHGKELAVTTAKAIEVVGAARFEVRKQYESEFWCVWDTITDCEAYSGQYTYLAYEIAVEHAALLNGSTA
ncbi:hypothetical protein ACQPTN_24880 [Bradyrhizobium sp. 13971]